MKICFLLERGVPPRLNPIIAEVCARLAAGSVEVIRLYPEDELVRLDQLRVEADLYLLKSDTELALSLALALEAMGAVVLNRARASALAKDKVQAAIALQHADLPIPRSWAAAYPSQLAAAVTSGPLIFKPYRGYHGAGVAIARTPASLPPPHSYPELVFAQDFLAGARTDLKVFVIGDEVFGVRKAFSTDSFLQTGAPVSLPPHVKEIALRCGQAFGLELYGLDIAETEDGAVIIDVNYFPGYRGVPDAARRLTDHILRVVER
jgi:ribosomal protein S6--L-glutamate ligase